MSNASGRRWRDVGKAARPVITVWRSRCVRATEERGYVAVMTALMIVPLMGFAGFAVDVGAWYGRASELHRAADAAALAGAVWQPDYAKAKDAALAEAARNGFTDGVDGIEVEVLASGLNQLTVQITDTEVDTYFAGLFLDEVEIGRQSVAEYSRPVPVGSPANFIGAGTQGFGLIPPTNAWVGMMGHCNPARHGDLLSIRYTTSKAEDCGGDSPVQSPFFRQEGHRWIIDVPTDEIVTVEIYDKGYCTGPRPSDDDTYPPPDKQNANIRFSLYGPDPTPLSHDDTLSNLTELKVYESKPGDGCNVWTYFAETPPQAGKYILQTETLDKNRLQTYDDWAVGDLKATNYFGFRVTNTSHPSGCLTYADPTCPGISAHEWIPIRVDTTVTPALFYLAGIGPEHAGKELKVSMWDLGENMKSVEILDPAGTALDFSWESVYTIDSPFRSGNATKNDPHPDSSEVCDLSDYCLFVTKGVFNGHLVEATVQLPLDWSGFSNNWFKIRYTRVASLGTTPDWTTWGAQVVGDPVRLVE